MIRTPGKVYLVGAGPGDPELITVRGARLLQQADLVIHDRLVADELLLLCRTDALLIDVGKVPGTHGRKQSEITGLLIEHARAGLDVVRLKGGDPFVFGRGFEELSGCREAGIFCEIVPGISSAIAGPAAVGVPVTARHEARSFAVVTARTDPHETGRPLDYRALAALDTVVFMMGRKRLPEITKDLQDAGRDPDTPAVCVQNATTAGQRTVIATLGTIAAAAAEAGLEAPVITVVGPTAAYARA